MSVNQLYAAIRKIAVNAQIWQPLIRHTVTPDEKYDLFRVSVREYQTDRFVLVIQAAAGLDSPENPLEVGSVLVLPTLDVVRQLYNLYNVDYDRG